MKVQSGRPNVKKQNRGWAEIKKQLVVLVVTKTHHVLESEENESFKVVCLLIRNHYGISSESSGLRGTERASIESIFCYL